MNTFTNFSEKRDYLPDSIYTICGEYDCGVCGNEVYSNIVSGMVHDSQRGKVFCPFGMGGSMNQHIYADQSNLNATNINANPGWGKSTWGHVPQMDPRPLAKIGLTWRTS
jgi:hypothetical protein